MDEMIFAALHVLFANQGAPLSVKSRVTSNRRFKWDMLLRKRIRRPAK